MNNDTETVHPTEVIEMSIKYDFSKQKVPQKERVKTMYKDLIDGLESLVESDEGWKRFLDLLTVAHRYSFRNGMLIALQCPNASLVMGARKWKDNGRNIKRGEKAIWILAPTRRRIYTEEQRERAFMIDTEERDGEKVEYTIIGFRAVPVFDISQTEGEPINIIQPTWEYLGLDRMYNEVMKTVKGHVPVEFLLLEEGLHGTYSPRLKRIQINMLYDKDQQTETLIHEFLHWATHESGIVSEDVWKKFTNNDHETIVESASFIVFNYYGFDISQFTFPYVMQYAGNTDKVEELGNYVMNLADYTINEVNARLNVGEQL